MPRRVHTCYGYNNLASRYVRLYCHIRYDSKDFLLLQMLTIAVLCIVITAPIGALGITLTQNRLLAKAVIPPPALVEEGVKNEPELLGTLA